ncbi:MAG: sigma-70 family RNA polymerase sigma factor [Gemmataceae bacterium]
MGSAAESGTRLSLLGILRRDPSNQEAWGRFVDQYGPKLYAWCLRWHLQDADAQDVTQNVLLRLAEKLRDFQYDASRSFRAWLKTLTNHACADFHQSRKRQVSPAGDSEISRLLENMEARQDLLQRLETEFDRELLELAMAQVRLRVAPQTWMAFHLTAMEGLSGAEASARINMQVAQVFVARRRVQKMLQEELARLDAGEPDNAESA